MRLLPWVCVAGLLVLLACGAHSAYVIHQVLERRLDQSCATWRQLRAQVGASGPDAASSICERR